MAKVLVADVPEMDERIRECLPEHDLVFVRTMPEAAMALRHDSFTLVVIGLHFDESHMFELLSHVRSLHGYHAVPVVCVQGLEFIMPEAVMRPRHGGEGARGHGVRRPARRGARLPGALRLPQSCCKRERFAARQLAGSG